MGENLIDGLDNTTLFIFSLIFLFILYALNLFLKEISKHRNHLQENLENLKIEN